MNHFRSVGITLLALSMGLGGLATAQGRDRDTSERDERQTERRAPRDHQDHQDRHERNNRNDRYEQNGRNDQHGRSHGNPAPSRWDNRDAGPRPHANQHSPRGYQGQGYGYGYGYGYGQGQGHTPRSEWRGAGPGHHFYRGDYLTPQYRSQRYVIENWRGHHLAAPPRGYHWVQTGGDYVLAAITTGLILQILLGH